MAKSCSGLGSFGAMAGAGTWYMVYAECCISQPTLGFSRRTQAMGCVRDLAGSVVVVVAVTLAAGVTIAEFVRLGALGYAKVELLGKVEFPVVVVLVVTVEDVAVVVNVVVLLVVELVSVVEVIVAVVRVLDVMVVVISSVLGAVVVVVVVVYVSVAVVVVEVVVVVVVV
mmetsp:Transcript_66885/g.185223  ORF Transcript_66885/g.185223 Transcript_66885/m.185223 type:complete len:170 (-) Transcript_66885:199-708(-)